MDKGPQKKKKANSLSREVINLLGSVPPMRPSLSKYMLHSLKTQTLPELSASWEWSSFQSSARADSLQLHHWKKTSNPEIDHIYSKYNIPIDIVPLSRETYDSYSHPADWGPEETLYFWGLCKEFDLRFIVIEDRYNIAKYTARSVEELKHRYYSLSQAILSAQGAESHLLCTLPFNPNYEIKRKSLLEKYYLRTREQQLEEKKYLEEARKLNAKINKEQKELKNFEKLMNANSDEIELTEWSLGRKESGGSPFLSSFYLAQPELPARLLSKIDIILREVGIAEKPMPTQETVSAYDDLKKEILILLYLQKYLMKKESEKRNLEEKLKDLKKAPARKPFTPAISLKNVQLAGNLVSAPRPPPRPLGNSTKQVLGTLNTMGLTQKPKRQ